MFRFKLFKLFFLCCYLPCIFASVRITPLSVRTTPRRRIYPVKLIAGSSPKMNYLELKAFYIRPVRVTLWSDIIKTATNSEKDKRSDALVPIRFDSDKLFAMKNYRFVVPAGVTRTINFKFRKKPPQYQRVLFYVDEMSKRQFKSEKSTKKEKVSASIEIKTYYIGVISSAKPKPYPMFSLKKTGDSILFINKSKRSTMAYVQCDTIVNKKKIKKMVRILIPGRKKSGQNKKMMRISYETIANSVGINSNSNISGSCKKVFYKKFGFAKSRKLVATI